MPNDNAMVAYRYGMLPFVEDENGKLSFGWPQAAVDTGNAMLKMGRAAQSAFGARYAPEDVNPTAQDAMNIAGLAMTGGIGAGLAGRSARAVSGHPPAQVEASRLLPSHSVEMGRQPWWKRALYGGDVFTGVADGKLPAAPMAKPHPQTSSAIGPNGMGLEAEFVTDVGSSYHITRDGRRIGRVNLEIDPDGNAYIGSIDVDAAGGPNSLGVSGLRDLREAFRTIYPDVKTFYGGRTDSGARFGPAARGDLDADNYTQYVTLPANPSSPLGLAQMGGGDHQETAMPDFNTAFGELQAALRDLDGDGVPDPVASVPPNAMAAFGGFPQMVAENPRGWGNAPPAPQSPMQQEPWNFQGEIRNVQRPQEYTAPLAEMTPPVIPGAGAILQAAPRIAGAVALGAGLSAMTGTEGEGTESPLQNLYSQQSALAQRRDAVVSQRDQEGASGKGPKWQALDQEAQRLDAQLSGINAMIRDENNKNSPEHQLEMQRKADELAAEQKAREAATPFRERYPNAAGALPMAGLAIAGAIPGAIGAKKAVGSFFPASYAGRMRAGISEAEAAIASGDRNAMEVSRRYLDNLVTAKPTRGGNAMEAFAAGASGGGLAAEANMFPDQYDAYNLPEGPQQEAARGRALDPRNYLERGAIGTLTGLSGYKIGSKLPERQPDIPRANAMADFMRGNPVSSAPPTSAKVVTRVKGKDGVVRYHDEVGNFTSAPNAKK